MTFPDWQIVATFTCIILAGMVVVRRAIRLIRSHESTGCHSGCSSCPARGADGATSSPDFVALQTLVQSGRRIGSA